MFALSPATMARSFAEQLRVKNAVDTAVRLNRATCGLGRRRLEAVAGPSFAGPTLQHLAACERDARRVGNQLVAKACLVPVRYWRWRMQFEGMLRYRAASLLLLCVVVCAGLGSGGLLCDAVRAGVVGPGASARRHLHGGRAGRVLFRVLPEVAVYLRMQGRLRVAGIGAR